MKAMFILVVILAVAGLGVYYYGGVRGFDATKQGEAARAAIQPGMTWNQVIAAAGKEPRHYRRMIKKGGPVPTLEPGGQSKFKADSFGGFVTNNSFPEGFLFEYRYSEQVAFAVHFSPAGTATGISDLTTMADLLQTR